MQTAKAMNRTNVGLILVTPHVLFSNAVICLPYCSAFLLYMHDIAYTSWSEQ